MRRLFILVFVLPWWAYFPLAGAVGYLAEQSYRSALADEAAKAEALTYDTPRAVGEGLSTLPAPRDVPMRIRRVGWLIAFGVVMLGLVTRFVKRAEATRRDPVGDRADRTISGDARPVMPLARSIAPNSPLGRIAAKRAPQIAAATGAPMPPPTAEPAGAPRGLDTPFLAKLALGMAAVGLASYDPVSVLRLLPLALPIAVLVSLRFLFRRLGRAVAGAFARIGGKAA